MNKIGQIDEMFSFKFIFFSQVYANAWTGETFMSLKTPTCVLFDKNKKFHSFGFEAEEKYFSLAEDYKHSDYYFFRRFKMKLFDQLVGFCFCLQKFRFQSLRSLSLIISYLKEI